MANENPFQRLGAEELDAIAVQRGFKRKGQRNWVRRTPDFLQLVNLQKSQWSPDVHYLNFALWPLAMGEPPTFVESKFHFRTRAESMRSADLNGFFSGADELRTLAQLRDAEVSGRVSGLMTRELRDLLP